MLERLRSAKDHIEITIMKIRDEVLKYGLSFPDTYQDAPFHDPNWQLVR